LKAHEDAMPTEKKPLTEIIATALDARRVAHAMPRSATHEQGHALVAHAEFTPAPAATTETP
jgi:hypothetical protein